RELARIAGLARRPAFEPPASALDLVAAVRHVDVATIRTEAQRQDGMGRRGAAATRLCAGEIQLVRRSRRRRPPVGGQVGTRAVVAGQVDTLHVPYVCPRIETRVYSA